MKNDPVVVDSYAWIEYFAGSAKGRMAAPYLEEGHGFTPLMVIAELSAYYDRKGMPSWEKDLDFIQLKTSLADLTLDIAKAAGQTRQKMRRDRPLFGLADAIIYETAKSLNASLLTGDPHFKGMPKVIFLEEEQSPTDRSF